MSSKTFLFYLKGIDGKEIRVIDTLNNCILMYFSALFESNTHKVELWDANNAFIYMFTRRSDFSPTQFSTTIRVNPLI